jgi:glycosyltransferase involved in cell wall biosynthesis
MSSVGVVVIGRNEGERLRLCLESVLGEGTILVYVDSGSTDDSVALADSFGAHVVELDIGIPFTAARARNAGFGRLIQLSPNLDYVQFIDGDCEMNPAWLSRATSFLDDRMDVAMVCGRLRERFPERTVYNRLCDIEWDAPPGETRFCGGITMARAEAIRRSTGFREDMIAGEEPELCVRLRAEGWQIWRLADEMALHDAAMSRFSQWWQRSVRAGYAFAHGARLHGTAPERHGVLESRRAWLWGLFIPLCVLTAVLFLGGWGLLLLAAYPLQVLRLSCRGSHPFRVRLVRSAFLVLGKFPELAGHVRFLVQSMAGAKARLIEYK